MTKAILALVAAAVLVAGYYVVVRTDGTDQASLGIVNESEMFAETGEGEGAVIAVSTSSVAMSMSGAERIFTLRPETVIFNTSSVAVSDLIQGESALVALRPGTSEVFAVTVFKDKTEVPINPDNAGDFFFGTIEDVLGDSAKLRNSKGEIKLVTLSGGATIKKIEKLEPSDLVPGDIVKVDWHTQSNEVIAAAIFLDK